MPKIIKKKKVADTPEVGITSIQKKNGVSTVVTQEGNDTPVEKASEDEFRPHVGLSLGVTKDMGNYESFKISAWGTTELLDGETYERAFERLSTHLEARIDKEIEKWT